MEGTVRNAPIRLKPIDYADLGSDEDTRISVEVELLDEAGQVFLLNVVNWPGPAGGMDVAEIEANATRQVQSAAGGLAMNEWSPL